VYYVWEADAGGAGLWGSTDECQAFGGEGDWVGTSSPAIGNLHETPELTRFHPPIALNKAQPRHKLLSLFKANP
jgi:hypothetical protein